MMNEIRILGEFSSLVMMNILERRRIQNEEYSIVGWRDNDMHRKNWFNKLRRITWNAMQKSEIWLEVESKLSRQWLIRKMSNDSWQ